jgi:hypothetical protein
LPITTLVFDVPIELTPVMLLPPIAIAPDIVPPANGRYEARLAVVATWYVAAELSLYLSLSEAS